MLRRLTALAFILALVAGTAAGAPLHSGDRECGMAGMDGMDCCEKARAQENSREVLAARLCCALNCTQPAPAGTNTTGARAVQAPASVTTHPVALPPSAHPLSAPHAPNSSRTLPSASPPGYIRHSSLLI
jgi:hypothetical protein